MVRNEFEIGENDPVAVLEARIVAAAYLWHNYGKDTIGSRTDIERVPATALRAFYERYYQPDNAVLVVAGKFDEPAALAAVERLFGAIPRPARVLTPSYTVEPVQDGERTVTLRRSGDLHAVGVAYHTVGAASPDYPAVQAALDLLDREPSGRLYKRLVEPRLAASVSAYQPMFRDPYLALVIAEVRDGKQRRQGRAHDGRRVRAARALEDRGPRARALARGDASRSSSSRSPTASSSRSSCPSSPRSATGARCSRIATASAP